MAKLRVEGCGNFSPRLGLGTIVVFLGALVEITLLCAVGTPFAAAQDSTKNVVVLYSFQNRAMFASTDLLESSLRARVPRPVNFYVDYLESERFGDPDYEKDSVAILARTYRGQKLDVVLVAAYPALQFALKHRNELFPGVPIVFFNVERRRLAGQEMWPGVTGATGIMDIGATINLALRLHPKTTTVAVITGGTPTQVYWQRVIHAGILGDHHELQEIDLSGLSADQLLKKLSALPPQTIVLFGLQAVESVHPAVGMEELLARIGQRFPTYCPLPLSCLGRGGIGGVAPDFDEQAVLAAQLAGRVLLGENPNAIAVVNSSATNVLVDWRQLRYWHIPESALPAGSVILFRPPSIWEQYRSYVIASTILIAALLLFVIALLWERTRKRKAEAELHESEKRFRVMADTTPSTVWMCDPQGKITYLNERRIAFTGRDPAASCDDFWITDVHPDDRRNVRDIMSQSLKDRRPFSNEYRLRRSDGAYRWMFDVASPRLNRDGSFAGFIGSAIDVTDQKLAQQALERVSGQLIEAQENERRRIARDLHDDICQRLALLSMEVDQANRSVNESTDATKERLREIQQHCAEIAADVQSLSHELHSSRLDYLGIVAAIRGFCHEFAIQHEVSIQFTDRDAPADLPRDISLCLFRVAQEALHNAVKHSGVSRYAVELTGTGGEIQLVVSDSGKGIDVDASKQNRGLGLVSMQERVHLVHGRLHVESEPGKGTKIFAVVPLANGIARSSDDKSTDTPIGIIGAN